MKRKPQWFPEQWETEIDMIYNMTTIKYCTVSVFGLKSTKNALFTCIKIDFFYI